MTNKVSLDKSKIKFVLLEGVHQSALDTLHAAGYTNIDFYKKALDGDELKEAIKDAHFIGLRSRTQLTAEMIEAAPKLIAIGCFCIGTNQVDLNAAKMRGIPVFNAPFSNTRSVAELVLGEILLLMRNIPQANADVHRGLWNKSAVGSHEVRGKKLGIVGYGHIGSQLSIIAESLGMEVYFYDIENKLPLGNAKQLHTLEELLGSCDVISLHVPDLPSTRNLMSAERIAQLKQDSILINAARGTVVDIDALAAALEQGKVRGAAVDVFPVEPASINEEFVSPLRKFDNVILTPHIGGSTAEAQENIGFEVAGKFVKYSDNGSTLSSVNFPEVSLPEHVGTKRLLHIHENRPGVLNKLNQIFVEANLNIAAQFLQTDPKIGYVVVDIDALAAALEQGKVRGAAVDVFPVEPASINEEFVSPLRKFDNVILTPHIGGSTAEAQENIGFEVAGKFVKYSDNGSTLSSVNFPEVSLPEHVGTKRLLHIHENRPGVLNQLNQIFVEANLNIAAQFLQTDPKIGYVVVDIETDDASPLLAKLREIEGTIKARVLY